MMKKLIFLLMTSVMCVFGAWEGLCEEKNKIINVSDGWLASIVEFIASDTVNVHPVRQQNGQGAWARSKAKDGPLWVLDLSTQKELGGQALLQATSLPIPHVYGDPATLPFIAQKVTAQLALLFPKQSNFYQRRLAEFETRLRSTLISGRSQLTGLKVLDPGAVYSKLWQALGCEVLEGQGAKDALQAFAQGGPCPWQGGVLVLDWTVARTYKHLVGGQGVFVITPAWSDDPIAHLHQLFLSLASQEKRQ